MILFKIAWRNLWRNKRRTLIILTSIAIGVACLMLNDSFSRGMSKQMLDNQVNSNVSHIQIHKAGFNDNKVIQNYIPDADNVENVLKESKFVKYFSKRIVTTGLLTSANASSGIVLMGIVPKNEKNITTISQSIVEGRYLNGNKNEVIIGKEMAEKLEVSLGDKVVAVASSIDGSVSTELFRIVGIYKTVSSDFDKVYCYVSISDAQNMLSLENNISEFAIIVDIPKKIVEYKSILEKEISNNYEVLSYQDLLPLMMVYLKVYEDSIVIFYMIIIIAILFGVINTMLMSVFERIHEIGVLMSVGMKNSKIFLMILTEAFVLGILGSCIGFGIGFIAFIFLSNGIDLSVFSQSLDSFGVGSIIKPIINIDIVFYSIFLMPLSTVLGACYPAIRAIKLQPTDAMRYI